MARVDGKVAIVTGGASGMGAADAEVLVREGASVVVADLNEADGRAVAERVGGDAVFMKLDVTDEANWQQVIASTVEKFGRLDILVNNAGVLAMGTVVDTTLESWRMINAVNSEGVFLGCKHAIPAMVESGGGSIINMSSVAGLKGAASLAAYNATKGGVRLFTKGVALECGQNRWNIRVNSVHPGIINTPIWTKVNSEFLPEGENAVDVDGMAETSVPTGVLGQPLDIANGVLFLASDESQYITGTELVIDAGLSA